MQKRLPFAPVSVSFVQRMKPAQHPTALRTRQRLADAGLDACVVEFERPTRTSAEAAAAIGCGLSQICKSLIFAADGEPVLVLMDGASRVDVERVRRELGAEKVTRAKADVVRETTGYAIGGVPPFGHRTRTRVLADRSLLDHVRLTRRITLAQGLVEADESVTDSLTES